MYCSVSETEHVEYNFLDHLLKVLKNGIKLSVFYFIPNKNLVSKIRINQICHQTKLILKNTKITFIVVLSREIKDLDFYNATATLLSRKLSVEKITTLNSLSVHSLSQFFSILYKIIHFLQIYHVNTY